MRYFNKNWKWAILFSALLLTGCNEMQQSKSITQQKTEKYTATSVSLTGKVAAKSGTVEALTESKTVIASTALENGKYQLEIPAQTKLPVILRCENWQAVVIDTDETHYDINAFTTKIAEQAKMLGGYTRQNMILAAGNSVNVPDANKISTGFKGDTTTQYGGWH